MGGMIVVKKEFKIVCLNCGNESIVTNTTTHGGEDIHIENNTIKINYDVGNCGSSAEILCEKCGNSIGG
jgi:ribosomal protein S27E